MELTEIASVHVAVPVFGVLLCAFLVFVFGFKSPAQPPSFHFEDERKQNQRKTKKLKSKSQLNGHAIVVPPPAELVSKPNVVKPKKASLPKTNNREMAAVGAKPDRKKEKKKQGNQEEVKVKNAAKMKVSSDDSGVWEVQKSRKDKKLKAKNLENVEAGDTSVGKPEPVPQEHSQSALLDTVPVASSGDSSVGESKTKKKKKSSKAKHQEDVRGETRVEVNSNSDAMDGEPVAASLSLPVVKMEVKAEKEDFTVALNKKNKKKKNTSSVDPETLLSNLAIAVEPTHPSHLSTLNAVPDAVMTEDGSKVSEAKSMSKSAKKKKNKGVVSASPSSSSQPTTSGQEESVIETPEPAVLTKSTKVNQPAESSKNKKSTEKNKSQEKIKAQESSKAAEENVTADSSKTFTKKKKFGEENATAASSEPAENKTAEKNKSALQRGSEVPLKEPDTSTASTVPVVIAPVTFDELGGSSDTWTEAPKNKKKKRARREN